MKSNYQVPAEHKVPVIYLILSILWIWLSDDILSQATDDLQLLSSFQTYKGWGFVAFTSLLLYWLIKSPSEKLRKQQQSMDFALMAANTATWNLDLNSYQITRSSNHHRLFGYQEEPDEWSMDIFLEHILMEDQEFVRKNMIEGIKNKQQYDVQYRVRWPDGSIRWLHTVGKIQSDYKNKSPRLSGVTIDISKEKKVRSLNLELVKALIVVPSAICIIKVSEMKIIFANNEFKKITNRTDLVGKKISELFPNAEHDGYIKIIQRVIDQGKSYFGEEAPVKVLENGETKTYYRDFICTPLRDINNEISRIFIEIIDVTERVEYKNQLLETVREKETLLQEIHHRVKNNLAVIVSLIELQQMELEKQNKNSLQLEKVKNRIFSIATLHEVLYQNGSLSRIKFNEVLSELVKTSAGGGKLKHNLSFQPDEILLNINHAVPLSLFFGEIFHLTQSPERIENSIPGLSITISEENLYLKISIIAGKNAGSILKETIHSSEKLESTLLHLFVNQLNGTLKTTAEGETYRLMLMFERKEIKGSASSLN